MQSTAGKKLGKALTSKMLAGIRDGSFSDLYVGDYIETEDNIYRFMDFDYFLGCCSNAFGGRIERHHAILVPDKVMSSSAIDNYPEVTQPKETHMYVNKLPEITQTLKGIFGNDNVAMMDRIITKTVNGESTGWDWVNVGADLLTEVMVMGHSSWGQWVDGDNERTACWIPLQPLLDVFKRRLLVTGQAFGYKLCTDQL